MADQSRVPDWLLERVALDQIPPGQADDLARRVAADPTAEARLAALRASNQEILAALPPAQVAAEVERRRRVADIAAASEATPERSRPRAWLPAMGAMAAAAVLALAFLPRDPRGADQGDVVTGLGGAEDTRAKGDPHLVIHRKRGDEVERLGQGAAARAGDLLQIGYVAAGHTHGLILSIDGAGVVTLHHPIAPDADTTLPAPAQGTPGPAAPGKPAPGKGVIELAHAYELDDAPAYERFFFITPAHASGAPATTPPGAPEAAIDVALILDRAHALARNPAAARGAPLELPDSLQQWSFLLRKETRP
jgi:hypothetical protein